MNTATRETLIERTVKPISRAPSRAASVGRHPLFDVAGDVFEHDDGVIHDKARGDRERHEREVVEAVAAQVHDAEGADERDRHGDARDDGARTFRRNTKTTRITRMPEMTSVRSTSCSEPRIGGVRSMTTERLIAPGMAASSCGSSCDDPVDGLDDVRPRLAENDDHHGGLAVDEPRVADVFHRVLHVGDVGELHRRAGLIGNDQRAVLFRLEELVVRLDLPGPVAVCQLPLGPVHVGARSARSARRRG